MKRLHALSVWCVLGIMAVASMSATGAEVEGAAPRSIVLSIYDTGFSLCNELRSVVVAKGENTLYFRPVPSRMDPASASLYLQAGADAPRVFEQQLRGVSDSLASLLREWQGHEVAVRFGGESVTGRILSVPREDVDAPLMLSGQEESIFALPLTDRIDSVRLARGENVSIEPVLQMRCVSEQDGPLNLRLVYTVDGINWSAFYRVILDEGGTEAFFNGGVSLENDSGGRFDRARVRLVETQKGGLPRPADIGSRDGGGGASAPAWRYAYGSEYPEFGRAVASAAAWKTFELPNPVTLAPGQIVHVSLLGSSKISASRFYVYDGVKLDRFDRNPRNDWNYGTAYHNVVDSYLEIANTEENGLGIELPRGLLTAYVQRPDGTVDVAGQGLIAGQESGGVIQVQLGPAKGLKGTRERTGYTEIVPLREYEETFEIRLENSSREEAEIRVVEHLYRWHRFEIVKADTEYVRAGERTIEFRPVIKPGGQRSIHYTVRYRW